MGNNKLIDHNSRGMPLPATQQAITNDQTIKLCPELEEAFLVPRNGRFRGHLPRANPGSHLLDGRVLVLSLMEADAMTHQTTT